MTINRREALKTMGSVVGAVTTTSLLPGCTDNERTSTEAQASTLPYAPTFGVASSSTGWGTNWTTVVAGKWSSSAPNGLLFYDKNSGHAEFYNTDGLGHRTLLKQYTNWSPLWDQIVPGYYASDSSPNSAYHGLLFYKQSAGSVAVYSTDGAGNISALATRSTRTTWTHIVAGFFTSSRQSSILLYSQSEGYAEIWQLQSGVLSVYGSYNYWNTGWTHIVAGAFQSVVVPTGLTPTDPARHSIFLYDTVFGVGDLYMLDQFNGDALVQQASYTGLPVGAELRAGNFAGTVVTQDLVFIGGGGVEPGHLSLRHFPDLGSFEEISTAQSGIDPAATLVVGTFCGDPEDHWFSDGPYQPSSLIDSGPFGTAPRWAFMRRCRASIGAYSHFLTYRMSSGAAVCYQHFPKPPGQDLEMLLSGYARAVTSRGLHGSVSSGSVLPGQTINFHINSQAGAYTVNIYTLSGAFVANVPNVPAAPQPQTIPLSAYRNPSPLPVSVSFTVPSTWTSNVYLARVATTSPAASVDLPFIVRGSPGAPNRILCVIPDATYEAYNVWGGRSLYGQPGAMFTSPGTGDGTQPYAFKVSLDRPYIHMYNTLDRWKTQEGPFAVWLQSRGITVDYCTNRDLDLDVPSAEYRLLVFIGHHEYWSDQMRKNVQTFTSSGGNVAYLGGNNCWWQVRFDYLNNLMVCYKQAGFDPALFGPTPTLTTVNWSSPPVNWPASGKSSGEEWTATTGLTLGGGTDKNNPADRTIVLEADSSRLSHWAFDSVTDPMTPQYSFGLTYDYHYTIVGSECDVTEGTTPTSFITLARAYQPSYQGTDSCRPYNGRCLFATMGLFKPYPSSTVFNASCIDWSFGLNSIGATPVNQITYNILTRLTNVAFGENGATATLTRDPNIATSYEAEGWGVAKVLDGRRTSIYNVSEGVSSAAFAGPNVPISLVIQLPGIRSFTKIVLYPRADAPYVGKGFPVNFTLDVWDGSAWLTRVTRVGYPQPTTSNGESFTWGHTDATDRIRIRATGLGSVPGYGYCFQLAEVEVY